MNKTFNNPGAGSMEELFERQYAEQLRQGLPERVVIAIDGWARSGKNTQVRKSARL